MFNADRYFDRIGWRRPAPGQTPTLDTLAGILRAHMSRIPWENLDVLLGRGVRLDLDSIQKKLVDARRGGYCYEHSTLLRAALEHAGFRVASHSARVILIAPRVESPRTHMILSAEVDGVTYLLDPGFGGHGPLVPMPLVADIVVRDGPDVHRLVRRDGEWQLEAEISGVMTPLWMSTFEPESHVDFVMANHFTSTWPESAFVQRMLMRAITPDGRRVSVANRDVTIAHNGTLRKSALADRRALRQLLADHFGFDLPEAEELKVPAIPEWD